MENSVGKYQYVKDFEKLGFGMFVHFGLYSGYEKGEWYYYLNPKAEKEKYFDSYKKFKVSKNWAKNLVKTAKAAGCKYITITTKHHEGFALYDASGLNEYDSLHSPCKRDLLKEFVDECNKQGIMPFFYHALLDWHHPDYYSNFPSYIDYLVKSVEILCTKYGKIGGLWFDGIWDACHINDDWQEDRLYATIRKYQPHAIIMNNTGLQRLGEIGHPEIDSVTFERGQTRPTDISDRYRTGEMAQVLNDHWGYAKSDINYKSVGYLIENLYECRMNKCNFNLNVGPMGNGELRNIDKGYMECIGIFNKANKNILYDIICGRKINDEVNLLETADAKYLFIKNVEMSSDTNVAYGAANRWIELPDDFKVKSAKWLDDNSKVEIEKNKIKVKPFSYGYSLTARILKIKK